jgi:hypothetical protein
VTKAAELAKMGEVLTNSQIGGRRNMFINGSMQVAERGTSLAMAHDGLTGQYLIDRWRISLGGTHEQLDGTYAQVADHPFGGNGKSLKWTTGTAESSYDADEYAYVVQIIEAQSLQHLKYSTSDAETITISFHVKSSITGTYALGLYKPDSTSRIFNQTYTIDSANTWEKKTLTFVGDTDSGAAIVNDNGQGLWISWHLATGSNYTGGGSTSGWVNYSNDKWADGQATNAVMTTVSATWQLADCQVEVGSQATPFEHRSFSEELALCQRYFYKHNINSTSGPRACTYHSSYKMIHDFFPVTMRAFPTATATFNASFTSNTLSTNVGKFYVLSGYDTGHNYYMETGQYDAEL